MSSETIDVESLLNFNRDLHFQQPKKDILYYVQIVPSHTSFSLILYLLYYVENQHKISRNLNKTRKYSSLEIYVCELHFCRFNPSRLSLFMKPQ